MACGRRTSSKRCQGKPSCWRTNRLKANSTTLHLLVRAGRIVAEQFEQAQKRVALWLKRWRKKQLRTRMGCTQSKKQAKPTPGFNPGVGFLHKGNKGQAHYSICFGCWQRGCRRSGGDAGSATVAAEEAPTARLPQRRRESTQASFGLSWHRTLQAINCHALTYYVMHEQKEEHTAQTAGCRAA